MFRTILAAALAAVVAACAPAPTSPGSPRPPVYRVDAAWPQALPEDNGVQLVFGQVAGIAVDNRNGHVWMVHRPASLLNDEWDPKANKPVTHRCCKSLPAVVEFDEKGRYLRGWGGPGPGYEWPKTEHGIYVDPEGNVWVGGNGNEDNQILKFTPDGKFLMQIGRAGKSEGSNSRTQLGRPAHMTLDAAAGELYVADGYGNRRVVVAQRQVGEQPGPVHHLLQHPLAAVGLGDANPHARQVGAAAPRRRGEPQAVPQALGPQQLQLFVAGTTRCIGHAGGRCAALDALCEIRDQPQAQQRHSQRAGWSRARPVLA